MCNFRESRRRNITYWSSGNREDSEKFFSEYFKNLLSLQIAIILIAKDRKINLSEMIDFQAQNVEMPDLDWEKIVEWIVAVAAAHGKSPRRISYCFCDDPYILEANKQFLGHDYFTDVITFDESKGSRIEGDVLISLDTVRSNAEGLGEDAGRELLRVIIHGVLHLCGIDDKGPGEREIMEVHENEALDIYDRLQTEA